MQITQAETLSSSYEIIYDSRLIGINIDDRVQIDFEYGTKRQEQTVSLRDDQKELRNRGCLASVTVRRLDDNKQLKKATFSYTYSSPNGSPMQFLKHAYLSGEGYYSMAYYNEGDIFPKHGTQEYDLWGYYNLKSNSVSPNANAARFGMRIRSHIRPEVIHGSNMKAMIIHIRVARTAIPPRSIYVPVQHDAYGRCTYPEDHGLCFRNGFHIPRVYLYCQWSKYGYCTLFSSLYYF